MGHTASIRFLEPVDPRTVWEAARIAVGAPADWTHHGLPADYPPQYITNLLRQADPCGASALVTMDYRPEGAPLDDSEWDGSDADPRQIPPPAYVQISLDTRWEHADTNLETARALAAAVGVAAAIRDGGDGDWVLLGEVTR